MTLITLLALLPLAVAVAHRPMSWTPPAQAQIIDQRALNAIPLASQDKTDGTYLFIPPNSTAESLKARPFHIYDNDFYAIIGDNPTLTLLADTTSAGDPLFHEAAVWYPPSDSMFFVQNAGAKAAGTGLNKSAIIQRIDLKLANKHKDSSSAVGKVSVETIPASPAVINPNGGTNWRGKIVFCGEGQGPSVPSALYLMEPTSPYNTTVLLNNFYGRQFNSLNDIAAHPNGWLYFTDVDYGTLQDFRAPVNIRKQVYRFNPDTGVVQAVSDHAVRPNGLTFSPDGKWLYVSDTGAAEGFTGSDWSKPASIYRLEVLKNGRLGPATLFAFASPGVPDGVHCDTKGNVYSGLGDGIHVWNSEGTLLGKIYVGATSANFQFAGKGRMVILAETQLFYATLAAEGAHLPGL